MTDAIFGGTEGSGADILERFGNDLNAAARRGDLEPVRCRDAEIARIIDILLRQTKHNPALVGGAGVGKTALAEGLAQRIVAGDVPAALRDVRIIALDHVALLAGTMYRGQYEERVRRLIEAVSNDPDVILFVDEMHNLIGQGTAMGVAMDAANMLKPALVREDMRVIGATTAAEYERWIKGDPALERRFQPVLVRELTHEEAMEVLKARRRRLEHHHAVAIADDALQAALVLTDKFVTDRAQPDKSIDVLDEACAHAQATATLPPELEKVVNERRRVDAAIRRRLARGEKLDGRTDAGLGGQKEEDPIDVFAREIGPALERIGAEIDRIFGNAERRNDGTTERKDGAAASSGPSARGAAGAGSGSAVPPKETLLQRRDRLDQELRRGLEQLGVVVRGADVARAVSAAVGKRIEWTA
ncbi:MAG: AAA family ATPase [Gemmatimonadales bacterium]|nr:AAA family ATPase [Gemmatimonadales bacterium]